MIFMNGNAPNYFSIFFILLLSAKFVSKTFFVGNPLWKTEPFANDWYVTPEPKKISKNILTTSSLNFSSWFNISFSSILNISQKKCLTLFCGIIWFLHRIDTFYCISSISSIISGLYIFLNMYIYSLCTAWWKPSPLQSPSILTFSNFALPAGMDTFSPDHSFLFLTSAICLTVRYSVLIISPYFFPSLSILFPFFINLSWGSGYTT